MGTLCLRFAQPRADKEKISEIAVQKQEVSTINEMSALLTFNPSLSIGNTFAALAISAMPLMPAHA
jgi:hypothetical protein